MQETLKAAFGEWGAVLAQFLITVVVVLALIALVYWLVRRYSGIRLGGIGRGRVPRLAVVDAMAIDSRRQLVLIRRDNVEHLILIGGPADIVVEPSIQRPRARPGQQPAAAAPGNGAARPAPVQAPAPPALAPQEPEPAPVANELIPFPYPRSQQPQRAAQGNDRITLRQVQRPASPPEPLPPLPPTVAEPAWETPPDATTAFRPPVVEETMAEANESYLPVIAEAGPAPEAQPPAAVAEMASFADEDIDRQPALDLGEGGAPATDPAEPQPPLQEDTQTRVNELEQEMARLLGEITSKRTS